MLLTVSDVLVCMHLNAFRVYKSKKRQFSAIHMLQSRGISGRKTQTPPNRLSKLQSENLLDKIKPTQNLKGHTEACVNTQLFRLVIRAQNTQALDFHIFSTLIN